MELSEADDLNSISKKKFSEIFDELFPSFLAMGMSAEEYWEGDNTLPLFYRKAYKLKVKNEREEKNFFAWLQGRYIADAISTCFSRGASYPKEPYELESKDLKPKTEAEEKEIVRNAAEGFAAFVMAKNKERQRKQEAKEKENAISANENTDRKEDING